ncbi:hypothetical protein J4E93_004232 [Alternaria ventricosa]|uniref:uncharacterized protein n=1 Tax=Alternaria ventricosa TaxID=1187951 RepID=UPI0020C27F43|nr:uncharacterized protein J4E93_004232 [Alternaria ventricosa]KAI4647821.1 hypothetical protein J4E93_004232 [Alternaria ventricosa]
MTTASDIDESFTKALNEAGELYNDDRLDECIEKTRALLANDAIPRYHRMKALLLLASTLGDWLDASNCHTEAESLWRVTRRWHPEGEDAELDKYMDDVREHLDEVGADLARTDPDAYDFDDDVDDRIAAHEEHVKDATAAMKTLELPDDEMEVEPLVGVPATEVAALADVPAIKIAAPAEGGSGIADGDDPQALQGQG